MEESKKIEVEPFLYELWGNYLENKETLGPDTAMFQVAKNLEDLQESNLCIKPKENYLIYQTLVDMAPDDNILNKLAESYLRKSAEMFYTPAVIRESCETEAEDFCILNKVADLHGKKLDKEEKYHIYRILKEKDLDNVSPYAKQLLIESAEEGYTLSLLDLGLKIQEGKYGFHQDFSMAKECFDRCTFYYTFITDAVVGSLEKLAEQGNGSAVKQLVKAHEEGYYGLCENPDKATSIVSNIFEKSNKNNENHNEYPRYMVA